MAELVADALISEAITALNWTKVTNQVVYRKHSSEFLPTKLEADSGENFSPIWKKLWLPSIDSTSRETLFLLIHNKLPTAERLFRIGMNGDPYCTSCIDEIGCFVGDREHVFCSCSMISELWQDIRQIVDPLLHGTVSNSSLITLKFNGGDFSTEMSWLIATYVYEIWKRLQSDGGKIGRDEFFGFLRFKFKNDQLGARMKMKPLPNLI